MKLSKKTITIIGWVGTFVLFTAYALNSLGFIESTGPIYGFSNLIAATLLGIRVYADRNWSNLALEIFFGTIAIITIVRYFFF
jgi:branched-subunit amino acid transport protein AzlD